MGEKSPALTPGLYGRLLSYVKPYWPMFIIVAIGNALYAGVDSYSMYLFKPILDKGFIAKDMGFLKLLPWLVIGLFIVRGLAGFSATYSIGWIGRRVVFRFREALFEKYLRLPARYFDQCTSGDLLAKMTYHVEQVTEATSTALTTLLRNGAFVIGLLIVMFITSWRFSCFILLVFPIVAILTTYVSRRFRLLAKRIQNGMGSINHIAEEAISGYKEIRLFGAQKQEAKRFYQVIHYNFTQEMKMIMTNAMSSPVIQMLGAFILAIILYFAVRGGTHQMSAGSFVTLLSSMLALLKPVRSLTNINSTLQRALAAAEDIFQTLDVEEEQDHGTLVLQNPIRGHIAFQNVSFHYQKDQAILKDLTLEIRPGEMVALVGRSGAGKSSLVNLLTRFYTPTSGRILLDNQPIETLTLESVRTHMAMVSQHVILFDDSIYKNIAFGSAQSASEQEVIEALKAAHAWSFVSVLPQGIHSRIGENGLNLSGGQRQRIAIARAILNHAPILILDEATSALDNESEQAIQQAITALSGTCTRIIIAHRLSTIQSADRIIVMDHGQIIEEGTHASLMGKKGLYAELVARQQL